MNLPEGAHCMIWATKSWKKKKKRLKLLASVVALLRGKQCYFLLFIQYLHLFMLSIAHHISHQTNAFMLTADNFKVRPPVHVPVLSHCLLPIPVAHSAWKWNHISAVPAYHTGCPTATALNFILLKGAHSQEFSSDLNRTALTQN